MLYKFFSYTGWAKNAGPRTHGHNFVKPNRLLKSIAGRFLGQFAVKWILKVSPHLAYVATLPCETFMSAKQAINDKLQGSVATRLRFSGVDNNEIKTGLLMSLRVKKN